MNEWGLAIMDGDGIIDEGSEAEILALWGEYATTPPPDQHGDLVLVQILDKR